MKLLGVACVLASASGCGVEPELEVELTPIAAIRQCDPWECGTNSGFFEDKGFYRLHLDGTPNADGFAIANFRKGHVRYAFNVLNGKLHGTNPTVRGIPATGEDTRIEGNELIGAQFDIKVNGVVRYTVSIDDTSRILSWASKNGQRFVVETYVMTYTAPSFIGRRNVCKGGPTTGQEMGMDMQHVLLFERENVDAEEFEIGEPNRNYLNFGCAGSALAKLHLTGHTDVAEQLGYVTEIPERQTMLKMIVADYCGTGESYTVGGQPLYWADSRDWMNLPSAPAYLEALWTPNGASCLNQQRTVANPPDGDTPPPVACRATIPFCDGSNYYNPPVGTHLISSNPYYFY